MNRVRSVLINAGAGAAVAFGFHEAYPYVIDALATTGEHSAAVNYGHALGDAELFVLGYGAMDCIREVRRYRQAAPQNYAVDTTAVDNAMTPREAEHHIIRN